jgi:hypothetical protein
MFRATPSYQLAMALLVLFVAYVLQVRTLPYLSHAKAVETFREHHQKVLEGNALHTKLNDDMRARAAYYKRSVAASNRSLAGTAKSSRSPLAASPEREGIVSGADLEAFYENRRSAFERQVKGGRTITPDGLTTLGDPAVSFNFPI